MFGICTKKSQATLHSTKKRGVGSEVHNISRRYRSDGLYQTKKFNGKFSIEISLSTAS